MKEFVMDDSAINAIVDGRAFLDNNGCLLTSEEAFFDYHSETDFSMDYLDNELNYREENEDA